MVRKTYTASQIAQFFLAITEADDNDLSNLKIQKLCYYAQGLVSAMRRAPLFSDRMEAWDHGPVIPSLYRDQKAHKSEPLPIPKDFDFESIDKADRNALSDLYEYYGQFSAWRLRNMTHEEKPWADAYKSANKVITFEALQEFFAPMVDEDYQKQIYK